MSSAGIVAAAFGHLTPVEGAVLQELIDVAVILNALRALRIVPNASTATPTRRWTNFVDTKSLLVPSGNRR